MLVLLPFLLSGCAFATSYDAHHTFARRIPLTPHVALLLGADPGTTLQLDLAAGTLTLDHVTLAGTLGIEWRW
jgi:hypothetical protein